MMLKYDWLLAYPRNMRPGHTLILSGQPDPEWCTNNLLKTTPFYQSNMLDEDRYVCDIVGLVITSIDSQTRAYYYKDTRNYELVLSQFPELVIEADPFRPDPVEVITIVKDGKQMTRWEHLKEVFKFA
jgi:hypothetical protein